MITLKLLEPRPNETTTAHAKNFLNETEMKSFLVAARKGRHGVRDYAMVLIAYRHGLRVSELLRLRVDDVDLDAGRIHVRRLKRSLSTNQPLDGDEVRALRAWLRKRERSRGAGQAELFISERGGPFVRQSFNYLCRQIGGRCTPSLYVHPHMLRHSCGYALANRGKDTRLIQDYLGHKDIKNTELYTRTSSARFEGLWRNDNHRN